jgi:hypothetical protein
LFSTTQPEQFSGSLCTPEGEKALVAKCANSSHTSLFIVPEDYETTLLESKIMLKGEMGVTTINSHLSPLTISDSESTSQFHPIYDRGENR